MKKIAVMGSGNGGNFQAIAEYFKNHNEIDITCLSNVRNAFILNRAVNLGINNQYLPFEDNLKYFSKNKFDLVVLAGYMKILPENVLFEMGKVINIHPSLLPAFKGSINAVRESFLAGVKVSGITIHWVTSEVDGGKIIAQYPVFISNEMHFDEFESEIHKIEHNLYPIVIDKILKDEVFDFHDLIKSTCSQEKSNCNSCSNCLRG